MKLGIVGALGQMGRSIARLALEQEDDFEIALAIEHDEHRELGKQYAPLLGLGQDTEKSLQKCSSKLISLSEVEGIKLNSLDGLIDFSTPESTLCMLEKAVELKIPCVIGTTGFTPAQTKTIEQAGASIPILLSSNMSLGVNLLFWLVKNASRMLKGHNFDPEIIDIHHGKKKDAPSGTARSLEKILLSEMNWDEKSVIHGREGIIGERPSKELGVHSLRGGDVIGEHSVYFLGQGERLQLTHQASHRNIFASGALKASKFLLDKEAGLYSMYDVLGLRK